MLFCSAIVVRIKKDGLVKSRHTGENRYPVFCNTWKCLDSGFRRNDGCWEFSTFDDDTKKGSCGSVSRCSVRKPLYIPKGYLNW